MGRVAIIVVMILASVGIAAWAANAPVPPNCWFQCGPTYNPFTGQPAKPANDSGDYVGGYRGELSQPLPGENGYRAGADHPFRRYHAPH